LRIEAAVAVLRAIRRSRTVVVAARLARGSPKDALPPCAAALRVLAILVRRRGALRTHEAARAFGLASVAVLALRFGEGSALPPHGEAHPFTPAKAC